MGLVHTQQDVLWFDVSVDDLTLSVEVGQALQNLKRESQCNCSNLPFRVGLID